MTTATTDSEARNISEIKDDLAKIEGLFEEEQNLITTQMSQA